MTAEWLQANNIVVKKSANPPREEGGLLSHVDLVQMLDIVDLDAGTTVAGKLVLMSILWLLPPVCSMCTYTPLHKQVVSCATST